MQKNNNKSSSLALMDNFFVGTVTFSRISVFRNVCIFQICYFYLFILVYCFAANLIPSSEGSKKQQTNKETQWRI